MNELIKHTTWRYFLIGVILLLLVACDKQPHLNTLARNDVILAFGDSLTYGVGVSKPNAYPALLQSSIGYTVINSGVPGETTEQALERLPQQLVEHQPKLVLLCIGGNDMLRKMDMNNAQSRIRQMIELIKKSGAQVVLIGVPTPTLFGGPPELYQKIATDFSLPYEGEILNTILKDSDLKSDTVHPNEKGYQMLAERIAELLQDSGAIK